MLMKSSYSPGVGECLDVSGYILKGGFPPHSPVVRMKVSNSDLSGGRRTKKKKLCICSFLFGCWLALPSWALWEPGQLLYFNHRHDLWVSWRCGHAQSKQGRGVACFSFPSRFLSLQQKLLVIDSFTVWMLLRFWYMESVERAGNVSAKSVRGAAHHLSSKEAHLGFMCLWLGVKVLWCTCPTDPLTLGKRNGDFRELRAKLCLKKKTEILCLSKGQKCWGCC